MTELSTRQTVPVPPEEDSAGKAEAPRGSLALKLFAATFPVTVLAVLATQLAVGWLEYDSKLTALQNRAQLLASLTVQAVSRPLWTMDRRVYSAQIAAISSDPAFAYARLVDDDGAVLVEEGRAPSSPTGVVMASLTVPDPTGGKALGRFELMMSKAELKESARQQVIIGLGAIVALLLAVFTAVHTMTGRLILRPLKALLAAMAKVERKVWTSVPVTSDDEMGRATLAFNQMVESLRSGDEAKRLLAELEKANRLILESIGYARRIQDGLLPDPKALSHSVAELHMHWEPLQLVGGDYCWLQTWGSRTLFFVADCTGHGVPGAFMTMIVASGLEQLLRDGVPSSPAAILEGMDALVRARLRQDRPGSASDDGLDAAACLWDAETNTLTYAGANIPLLYSLDGHITALRGNRSSLGYRTLPARLPFQNHAIPVRQGMSFYLFTDGVPDHMGGQPRRLFGRRRLAELLTQHQHLPLEKQIEAVLRTLDDYRGDEPRRDDMAVLAFRPL